MKSYNKGVKLLETILENWRLRMEVKIIPREWEDILESKDDKVFTVWRKSEVLYFENNSVNEEEKESTAKEQLTKNELRGKPAVDVAST